MAMNVWNSRGAGPRKDTLGLGEVVITVPNRTRSARLADRLKFAGVASHHTGAELRFDDPWATSSAWPLANARLHFDWSGAMRAGCPWPAIRKIVSAGPLLGAQALGRLQPRSIPDSGATNISRRFIISNVISETTVAGVLQAMKVLPHTPNLSS